jgi:hypothetical protein
MSDYSFITQIHDNPLALIVLGFIVLLEIIKIIPHFIKWLISKIKKEKPAEEMEQKTWQGFIGKRIDKIEKLLNEDAQDRKSRQAELDQNLDEIKVDILKLFSMVADIRKFQRKISQGTLENMLFNERLSVFKRLKAFRRLLAMGVNGDIKQEGIKLVLANKETWKIVLQTKLGVRIKDQKYYEESLAYIAMLVFDKV